jgi:pimeloyl-ACP methyl ester carboxylesterase
MPEDSAELGGRDGMRITETGKVTREKAATLTTKAAKIRNRNKNVAGAAERFNAGLPLLTRAGAVSEAPTDPRTVNAVDFTTPETNAAGVKRVKTRLSEKIQGETEPGEIARLEEVRDNLQEETLPKPITRTTELGDYIREVPETESIQDPETGQIFRFVRYNWDKFDDGEAVTVSFPTYNTRTDNNSTAQARDSSLATLMPDRPLIALMHPGMGSNPLTKEQIKELKGQDAYFSIADAELRILKALGIDNIDLVGSSMGAFAALAVADRAGEDVKINKVVLGALPGVQNLSTVDLAKGLLGDGKYLPTALSSPFDPFSFQAGNYDHSLLAQYWELGKYGARAAHGDPIWHKFPYVRGMARETATDRLRYLLNSHPESSAVIITGTEDNVSPVNGVNNTVRTLRDEGIDKNRLARIVFPGGSHVVMENAVRYAGTIKHALTGTS